MLIELTIVGCGAALWSTLKKRKQDKISPLASEDQPIAVKHSLNGVRLLRDIKDAIWGEEREKLHMLLDPSKKKELAQNRLKQRKELMLSTASVGMAFLGTLVPVFYPLGFVAVIYLARNIFKATWQDFKQKHFISFYSFTVLLFLGMLLTGKLILVAASALIGGSIVKLIRKTEVNAQNRLVRIFSEQPKQVWLYKDGMEIQIAFDELQKNDVVVVHAGEIIPVDGIVQRGTGSVDQHVMTGESQLIERTEGDRVFAATLLLAGNIRVSVDKSGEQTVVANIGRVLNETQEYTTDLKHRGKAIADKMLLVELSAGVVTLGLLGPVAAIGVMWSGLGSRMMAYGPITVLNYLQLCSKDGILVKDGRVLEALHKVDTVVFDKTGTLTLDRLTVGTIYCLGNYDEDELLYYAAAAEYRQSHPVAKAIIDKALAQGMIQATPDETRYKLGYGIEIQLQEKTVCVGSVRFMQEAGLGLPPQLDTIQQEAEISGYSLVCIGINHTLAGVFELQPELRPEAQEMIHYLKQRDLAVHIISGDNQNATRHIAETLGVDGYFAEVLPEGKSRLINQLRDEGKFVCFIGDGINDAVALKSAQVSISLRGASSAATDTAQVVLMGQSLKPLRKLFDYSSELEHTMNNNLIISTVPGIINISGVYLFHIGLAASMGIFYAGTAVGLCNTCFAIGKTPKYYSDKYNQSRFRIGE